MRIEPPGAAIGFTRKLARETGWTPAHAELAMEEYRRFLYLAATTGHPVSPAPDVDLVWHLHLTYSRHYWDMLCGQILGRPLHHDPSSGGAAEDARHREQYARTLQSYRTAFACDPPWAIWPAPDRAVRVTNHPNGRPMAAVATAAGASLMAIACSAREPGNAGMTLAGWLPLIIAVAILLIAVIGAALVKASKGGRGDERCGSGCGSGGGSDSDSSCGSSCGGGCGGGD
jgi:hypothetical protein